MLERVGVEAIDILKWKSDDVLLFFVVKCVPCPLRNCVSAYSGREL